MNPEPRVESWRAPRAFRRLDLALVAGIESLSRAELQRLIRDGRVSVDGEVCRRGSRPVEEGTRLEVRIPPPAPMDVRPEPMDLEILFEDDDLLVLNKAPGVVVHPGAGHAEGTLVHGLLHHCGESLSGIGGVERPGIVHRLDRDTSGCLVVAKTDRAHRRLVEAFAGREMDKRYLALAWGEFDRLSFRVEKPIGRSPHNRQKMAVRPDGREAVSEFRVRERFEAAALLEVRLLTGRTHQIRVHLASIGRPVVGDRVYGRARKNAPVHPARQMLHAWRLRFAHPVHGGEVAVEAPLPPDFEETLRLLRGSGDPR